MLILMYVCVYGIAVKLQYNWIYTGSVKLDHINLEDKDHMSQGYAVNPLLLIQLRDIWIYIVITNTTALV